MGSIHKSNKEALKEILDLYSTKQSKVLDISYGTGAFWNKKPNITLDLFTNADVCGSFYNLPFAKNTFDTIVFDPPYRMNGTKVGYALTDRYKNETSNYKVVPLHYKYGTREVYRVLVNGGILIAKMQDQVVSGKFYFQTNEMLKWASQFNRLIDEVHVITGSRPQPKGRQQKHIRTSHSTFQIWEK